MVEKTELNKITREFVGFLKDVNSREDLDKKLGNYVISRNSKREINIEATHPHKNMSYILKFVLNEKDTPIKITINPILGIINIQIKCSDLIKGYAQIFSDKQGDITQIKLLKTADLKSLKNELANIFL